MTASRRITLFHAPNTRSTGALALLEELGADFELQVLNFKASEQRAPAYLAVNPMGKVPAVKHGDALVTEQVAYSCTLRTSIRKLAWRPDRRSAARPYSLRSCAPYLRWMVYYGSCFEPALIDRALKRDARRPRRPTVTSTRC